MQLDTSKTGEKIYISIGQQIPENMGYSILGHAVFKVSQCLVISMMTSRFRSFFSTLLKYVFRAMLRTKTTNR